MTIKCRFTFPSEVDASYFVTDLIGVKINRYAWNDREAVDVTLEDERNKDAVDKIASFRHGLAVIDWAEK